MATLLTDLATAEAGTQWRIVTNGVSVAPFSSDREKAKHSYATAVYTCTGTEVTGDIINLCDLPVGSVVIPDSCKVFTNGTGGTGAISTLGDAGSINRYSATSIAVASAGVNNVTAQNAILTTLYPYKVVAGNETLKATLTLSTALTSGALLVFRIAYILP